MGGVCDILRVRPASAAKRFQRKRASQSGRRRRGEKKVRVVCRRWDPRACMYGPRCAPRLRQGDTAAEIPGRGSGGVLAAAVRRYRREWKRICAAHLDKGADYYWAPGLRDRGTRWIPIWTQRSNFSGALPPSLRPPPGFSDDGQPPFVISCMPMAAMNSFGFGDTPLPPSSSVPLIFNPEVGL